MKQGKEINQFGTIIWYKDGKYHREDGPAIKYADGTKVWYLNGECHREDGPAIEQADGYNQWWYRGKIVKCSSQKQFEQLIKLKPFW